MNELRSAFIELVIENNCSLNFSYVAPDEMFIGMYFWVIDNGMGRSIHGNSPMRYSLLELLTDIRIQLQTWGFNHD